MAAQAQTAQKAAVTPRLAAAISCTRGSWSSNGCRSVRTSTAVPAVWAAATHSRGRRAAAARCVASPASTIAPSAVRRYKSAANVVRGSECPNRPLIAIVDIALLPVG